MTGDVLKAPWRPISEAKRDGRLLILLVDYSEETNSAAVARASAAGYAWFDNRLEDETVGRTLGSNNFDNDGEDLWRFAGWNWSQDFWCEGDGTPVAFIDLDTVTAPDPSADALRAENEALKAERDRYKPEPHPHEDMWSVVYRPGPPTVEDYDEAITALRNAQTALTYGDSMGCRVCEDSGHSAAYCHHNPLLLARKWAAASRFWQCWHCGFVARNDEEGRAHFGQHDGEGPACLDALRAENERLKHIANEWADTATSGLQWLRNIRDGISTVEDALSNMDACLEHCQETARQSLGGRDG